MMYVCRKEYNEKQACKLSDSYKRNIGTRNTQLSTTNLISISIIIIMTVQLLLSGAYESVKEHEAKFSAGCHHN